MVDGDCWSEWTVDASLCNIGSLELSLTGDVSFEPAGSATGPAGFTIGAVDDVCRPIMTANMMRQNIAAMDLFMKIGNLISYYLCRGSRAEGILTPVIAWLSCRICVAL
jgi:hypothetical protein